MERKEIQSLKRCSAQVCLDGFTHREGVRNILRVKEFQGPASAGGAPSNLYVLDLVVGAEVVKP